MKELSDDEPIQNLLHSRWNGFESLCLVALRKQDRPGSMDGLANQATQMERLQMNERIESLIELSEVWNTDGDVDKCEVDLYKFAELIVRECVDIADDYDGVGSTIVSRIKQHFGIEPGVEE